ncbi:MAG: homocysteine S-methyltransferase family protein [Streptococcus salivarius]
MLEKPSLLTPTQVRFMMVVRRLGNLRTGCSDLVEHSKVGDQFGVKILGGCCRTRPNDIKALYAEFRT